MKPISPDKTYVLRDGEEYEVKILKYPDSSADMVLAGVRCLNTHRASSHSFTVDGHFLASGAPHPLDLIDRLEWTVELSNQAPHLLQLGTIYRPRVYPTGLLATPIKLGDRLTDSVQVTLTLEETGVNLGRAEYCSDGSTGLAHLDEVFGLVPAYPQYSTWRVGDPIMIRCFSQWERAVFLGFEDGKVIANTHGGPGLWLSTYASSVPLPPACVRPPTSADVKRFTTDWSEAQLDQLFQDIARMRKSWVQRGVQSDPR